MSSEAQREAVRRYTKKTAQFVIRLRKDKDADVIERLMSQDNRIGYIRRLIRQDIDSTGR